MAASKIGLQVYGVRQTVLYRSIEYKSGPEEGERQFTVKRVFLAL